MRLRTEPVVGALAFAVALLGSVWKLACDPNGGGLTERTASYGCYTDMVPLYYARGLIDGAVPYLDAAADGRYLEYPVLTGALVRVAQVFAAGDAVRFTLISWVIGAVFAGIAAVALQRLAGTAAAFVFALSPLLFFEAGINWDLAPTALALLALLAWRRSAATAAGVFLGLGAAAKLWPGLLLPVLLFDAARTRNPRAALRVTVAAAASWLVVNLPIALANREGWWEFYAFSRERGRDWGSLWLAVEYLGVTIPETATINTVSSGFFVLALAAVGHLMWHQRISVALGALIVLYAFTLVGKVYSPQYSVWLLALLVITLGASRWVWAWTAVHLLYFFAIWRHLLDVSLHAPGGLAAVPYAWVTVGLHASTAVLVVVQLRREVRATAR